MFSRLPRNPTKEKYGGDPVQDGRRTLDSLRKSNVSVPVAHAPTVSPLARDLVLHGVPETLKPLGEAMFRDIGNIGEP